MEIISNEEKIFVKYNVLEKEELTKLKEIIYNKLDSNCFVFNYKEKCISSTVELEKEKDMDIIITKIVNNISSLISKIQVFPDKDKKVEVSIKLLTSNDEEEYNIDFFEDNIFSLKYSFKVLDSSKTKSLVSEHCNFEKELKKSISMITLKVFTKIINEILANNKIKFTIHGIKYFSELNPNNENIIEILKSSSKIYIVNNDERLDVIKASNVFEENNVIIEKIYNYLKVSFQEFLLESFMNFKEMKDTFKIMGEEKIKTDILEKTMIDNEEIINQIYKELIILYDEYKLVFFNCIDSQGHYKFLIPGDPIPFCLPHIENSCIVYPGHYINKKKKTIVNVDDIEGYILIKLYVKNERK